jgi:hypothetical protein
MGTLEGEKNSVKKSHASVPLMSWIIQCTLHHSRVHPYLTAHFLATAPSSPLPH